MARFVFFPPIARAGRYLSSGRCNVDVIPAGSQTSGQTLRMEMAQLGLSAAYVPGVRQSRPRATLNRVGPFPTVSAALAGNADRGYRGQ